MARAVQDGTKGSFHSVNQIDACIHWSSSLFQSQDQHCRLLLTMAGRYEVVMESALDCESHEWALPSRNRMTWTESLCPVSSSVKCRSLSYTHRLVNTYGKYSVWFDVALQHKEGIPNRDASQCFCFSWHLVLKHKDQPGHILFEFLTDFLGLKNKLHEVRARKFILTLLRATSPNWRYWLDQHLRENPFYVLKLLLTPGFS